MIELVTAWLVDRFNSAFDGHSSLRNRAITVSRPFYKRVDEKVYELQTPRR